MTLSILRGLVLTAGVVSLQVSAADSAFKSGPEVGDAIPRFELADQHGKPRDLDSLAGRNGLLLLFYRTADW